jgi:uncharacterized repeat protein (TIGR03803 family)
MNARLILVLVNACLLTSATTEAQIYSNLYGFTAYSGFPPTNNDGALPLGGVALAGNVLYGTTSEGGTNGQGTLFSVNTDATGFKVLHVFQSLSFGTSGTNKDGAAPHGSLTVSGGSVFGTTSLGGPAGYGTLFRMNTDGSGFTNLHVFTSSDGAYPTAELLLDGNTLYGTAGSGGSIYGVGTVFRLRTDGSAFTNLHAFTAGADGALPQGGLLLSGSTLYGTTSGGGTNAGMGVLFSLSTNGTAFKTLHTFPKSFSQTNRDGTTPEAGLILSGDTLFGAAAHGGTNGNGTLFSISTSGQGFTVLHSFAPKKLDPTLGNPTNSDGAVPLCTLTLKDGTLYGTSQIAGIAADGTIFSLGTNGSGFKVVYTFVPIIGAGFINSGGVNPAAGLILSGGTFYGTTSIGGGYDGNVFALTPTPSGQTLLSVQANYGFIILTWSGSFGLQSALSVDGPYSNVLGATSPYAALTTNAQQFFRLH